MGRAVKQPNVIEGEAEIQPYLPFKKGPSAPGTSAEGK